MGVSGDTDSLFERCKAALERRLQEKPNTPEAYRAALVEVMQAACSFQDIETPEILREMFERLLALKPVHEGYSVWLVSDQTSRKSSGSFYTPYYIIDYIVAQTLAPLLEKAAVEVKGLHSQGLTGDKLLKPYLSIRVLDAAVGTGRFLTQAARAIADAIAADPNLQLRAERRDIFRLAASNCIYGLDINPLPLEAAALVLSFEAGGAGEIDTGIRQHLRVGNALTSRPPGASTIPELSEAFDWRKEFQEVFNREPPGFDAVIGNPPWLSFSGRESSTIDKDLREYLYAYWPSSRGWPSAHGIFLELATHLCRPGGMIGQIFPEQALDLSRYGAARDAVFSRAEVISAPVKVDERAFDGVTSPACILILQRSEAARRTTLLRADTVLTSAGLHYISGDTNTLRRVVEKMRKFSPLPRTCFGDPGVHTGNSAKLLVRDAPDENAFPMRIGRDIVRYHALLPSQWLVTQPASQEGSYFRIGPLQRYHKAQILVRQTAAFPIAARHIEPTYFRNSLLACYGAEGFSVEYQLAILNSRLVRFFHQFEFRDGRQRAFPQVKVQHLRAIPVPGAEEAEPSLVLDLEALALKMEEGAANSDADLQVVDQKIDQIVCALYGVTDEEREAVESFLQDVY